jgi:hypothetical protein
MRRALIGFLTLVALAGCATTDRPLDSKRLDSIPRIEVARYATPEMLRHSGGTILGGGLLFGGFGMDAAAASAGKALREKCNLEDFGELVMQEFVAQVPTQIPDWPPMRVRAAPIDASYVAMDAALLAFQPTAVWLYSFGPKGLTASVAGTLSASGGEVIWKHQAFYSQRQANREQDLEVLEADSCKLLKEEMRFAARLMAGQFIADLSSQRR